MNIGFYFLVAGEKMIPIFLFLNSDPVAYAITSLLIKFQIILRILTDFQKIIKFDFDNLNHDLNIPKSIFSQECHKNVLKLQLKNPIN
jgi:hypothetical protein